MDQDARNPAEDRREGEAVRNARHRISLLAQTVGAHHPEYAGGLNQLALLLIMQGDPDSAEPLLREALEIRREALGERHPDYATNLSSLGGLLWARGALDEAEPLLRNAAEIRVATLGDSHPKTLVSLNSLEQLLQARRIWDEKRPSPLPTSPPPRQVPPPVEVLAAAPLHTKEKAPTDAPVLLGLDALAGTLDELRREFAALGERLQAEAAAVTSGALPSEALIWSLRQANARFRSARQDVRDQCEALSVSGPETGWDGLDELIGVIPALREAEEARRAAFARRSRVLDVLARVQELSCPSNPTFAPLERCRSLAGELSDAYEEAGAASPPDEAEAIASGAHPFNALLSLLASDNATQDDDWASWYDRIDSAFGTELAVAAARTRIVPGASQSAATS